MHLASRLTSGAEGAEPAATDVVQQRLREDASRGVVPTEKQDVVLAVPQAALFLLLVERL